MRIAPRRVAWSLLLSSSDAWMISSIGLISGSVSLASAFFSSGSIASSAPPASSLAAASRTARSGEISLSAASAVASSRRRRLLTFTSSRSAGSGSTFCAGHGVDACIAFDDEHQLAGRLQFAVGQCLQQCGGLGIALGDQRGDGGDLLVAFAEGKLAHDFRIQRAGRQTHRQQQNMTSEMIAARI